MAQKETVMPTIADELRQFADQLDKDWEKYGDSVARNLIEIGSRMLAERINRLENEVSQRG